MVVAAEAEVGASNRWERMHWTVPEALVAVALDIASSMPRP